MDNSSSNSSNNNSIKNNNWIYHAFTNIELETIFFCLGIVERMLCGEEEKLLNEFILKDTNFKQITKENIQRVKKKLEKL